MKLLLPLIITLPLASYAKLPVMKIDEKVLMEQFEQSAPGLDSIEASYLGTAESDSVALENLTTQGTFAAGYTNSDHTSINSFRPVTTEAKSYEVGISKNFALGMSASVTAYTEMAVLSSNPVEDATTGVKLGLGLDLFKDFLGRTTKNSLAASHLNVKTAKIQKDVQKKALFQSIRKIYWAMVANAESTRITSSLLEFSKKQAKQAKRRLKNSIADEGEVARYESQVASRRGQIIYLNYQKETLVQQLKEILPQLAGKDIVLNTYKLEDTIKKVMQCTQLISKQSNIPYDYTQYDEVLAIITKQNELLQIVNSAHNDVDVVLSGELDSAGNRAGLSDSISNYTDDAKSAYSLGLSVSIPLGSQANKSEDIKKRLQQKRYENEQKQIVGKLGSYHSQTVKNIFLLNQVIDAQVENTAKLKKTLDISRKKYGQARISVRDLINDQDLYLQSNLSEVDTKLAVINTLLDYFSVFTETPCQINKAIGK